MVNKILVQGVIIYIVFVIGISIVSEWLVSKVRTNHSERLYRKQIDKILDQVREDIKREYYFKARKYIPLMKSGDNKENFSEVKPYERYTQFTEEDLLMKKADEKLRKGLPETLDEHSEATNTIGEVYRDVDSYTVSRCPEHYKDLSKKFKKVERQINWQEPEKVVIPPKEYYDIDYKYEYEPGLGGQASTKIPGKKGEAPEKYFFKEGEAQKQRITFLDEKYSPENYKVEPLDGYATSLYSVYE